MRQLRVGELRPVQPASALEQPLGSPVFCCLLYAGAPIAAATARESQLCSSHRVLRYTDTGLQDEVIKMIFAMNVNKRRPAARIGHEESPENAVGFESKGFA